MDSPTPGRVTVEPVGHIVGLGVEALVLGRMSIPVDHADRLAEQLLELAGVQAGAVDWGDVPGECRSLLAVEAADLRYNPNRERTSRTVREGVVPVFGGIGVPEP